MSDPTVTKRALILLTTVNLVNYLDRYIISAVGPKIQDELQISNFQLGLLMSAFMIGYMVTSPIFGRMGDKGNQPKLMAFGVMVWSVATFVSGMMRSFTTLFIARCFVGIGEASFATISPAYIKAGSASENEANKKFSVFYCALPAGAALGFILGGAIAEYWSWQMAFFVAGLPGIVLAIAIAKLAPIAPPIDANQISDARATFMDGIKSLSRIKHYVLLVMGYTFYTFAMGGFAAWAPKYGVAALGVGLNEITMGFGIVTLLSATGGTLVGGKYGNMFVKGDQTVIGFAKFCAITTLLSVPFAALAFMSDNLIVFLLLMFVVEFLMFCATAPINTAILGAAPAHLAATAVAVSIFVIHAFGDLISPPIVGQITDFLMASNDMSEAVAMRYAMLLLPAVALLGGAIWLRLRREEVD